MHPELVIICDEIRVHIKDGKLLTITIGNAKPFDYQQIIVLNEKLFNATAYEDQKGYFYEKCEAIEKLQEILTHFKRYNYGANENPLLNSICSVLTEKNANEFLSFFKKDFFNN